MHRVVRKAYFEVFQGIKLFDASLNEKDGRIHSFFCVKVVMDGG